MLTRRIAAPMIAMQFATALVFAQPPAPAFQAFGRQEQAAIYAAALRDTFQPEASPHFDTPPRVFLGVRPHKDPSPELLLLVADLPFGVRKRSECPERRTPVGVRCVLAAGEAEVWLGAITRVGQDEAELVVAVEAVSCRRRVRREAGVWRMVTHWEFAGPCRVE